MDYRGSFVIDGICITYERDPLAICLLRHLTIRGVPVKFSHLGTSREVLQDLRRVGCRHRRFFPYPEYRPNTLEDIPQETWEKILRKLCDLLEVHNCRYCLQNKSIQKEDV